MRQNRYMQLQNGKSNSAKFMHGKINKKSDTFIYIHLVETFALTLHSKIVYKKVFWLKLSILKQYTTCT